MQALADSLNAIRNPLGRVKRKFSRYIIITLFTGALSFVAALALLRLGIGPLVSLTLSALASGALNYFAMEFWAFPHREGQGALSPRRLMENAFVGIGGFGARYLVLTLALKYIVLPYPLDNAVPLLLAYLTSFIIGYSLRSLVVFK